MCDRAPHHPELATSIPRISALLALLLLAGAAASQDPDARPPRGTWPLGLEREYELPPGALPSESEIELGRRLFFDPILSADGQVSCASCHSPSRGYADGRRTPLGVGGRVGKRNAPSVVNRLFGREHFWDGRAASLAEQALGPLLAADEMGNDPELLRERLAQDEGYRREFQRVYGAEPQLALLARALAAFQLTLVSGDSAFDRWEWGGESEALDAAARRGLRLFRGKARCTLCHTGFHFSDERYHSLGLEDPDPGRAAVTGEERDRGAFRTPSLRNVALTAPYLHDGSLASLEEVVEFYARGGGGAEHRSPLLAPLDLDEGERRDLVGFLHSLTGPIVSLHGEELQHVEAP